MRQPRGSTGASAASSGAGSSRRGRRARAAVCVTPQDRLRFGLNRPIPAGSHRDLRSCAQGAAPPEDFGHAPSPRRGMTGYTSRMKTAISLPDGDFERFERIAARHDMNRSEFYRLAAQRFADELEGEAELTAMANAAIARAGQPHGDAPFLNEVQRLALEGTEW